MQASRIAVTFVAACLVGGQIQAQPIGSEKSLPSRQLLARHGLELVWWGQGVLNPTRDTVHHLSSDEDCVYVQSTGGIITAFDLLTGQRRWAVQLGRFDSPAFQAVSNEELVLIVVGTSMYGLDKVSGRTLWELRIPGLPSTSPSVDDRQMYIGMLDGSVYAFDLRKIHALFREGRLPEWSFQAMRWRFRTSQEITSPPLVFGTRLLLASRDGNVYAVTTDNRDLVFQFETGGPVVAPLTRAQEVLFIACEDLSFYALRVKPQLEEPKNKKLVGAGALGEHVAPFRDRESGRVLWEFSTVHPLRKAPVPIGSDIFLMPERDGFYALSLQTGIERWWQPQGSQFVAATGQKLYVSDRDNNLLVLARENGSLLASLPLRSFPIRFCNDRTDRIIASTPSGLVICLREKGRSIPIFHMYPERLPILPEFASEEGEPAAEESPQPDDAGIEN